MGGGEGKGGDDAYASKMLAGYEDKVAMVLGFW